MLSFGRLLALGLLMIIVTCFSLYHQHAPIKANFSFPTFFGVLGGLFIIVLLVERATEIVITLCRQPETSKIKTELERKTQQDPNSPAQTRLQEQLADYQAQTKTVALLVGFSLAIVVCGAGVGMLESILDTTHADQRFIRGVDILLTSGLIAGGSDSFHQFVRALETFFKESIDRMKQS